MITDLPDCLKYETKQFLSRVVAWAKSVPDLCAVALAGSQARGDASPSSDIDLILLSEDPNNFLKDRKWISQFGEFHHIEKEDWGKVTCLRAFYTDGLEVEFGVAGLEWAADPSDEGDGQVIKDGLVILYETDRHLSDKVKQFKVL